MSEDWNSRKAAIDLLKILDSIPDEAEGAILDTVEAALIRAHTEGIKELGRNVSGEHSR
jgi:hypothetical protein